MKPSERAAKAVYSLIAAIEQDAMQGDRTSTPAYLKRLSDIIARETGCDANADIVRRLVKWYEAPSFGGVGLQRSDICRLDAIILDAKALLAGGAT